MAVDTIMAYAGVYSDAAVVERRADGEVKIAKHHETRPGSRGCWAAGSDWPPGWSWPCSRSPPSGVGCWSPRPAAGPRWGRWPARWWPG
jgi:hypothetical protein